MKINIPLDPTNYLHDDIEECQDIVNELREFLLKLRPKPEFTFETLPNLIIDMGHTEYHLKLWKVSPYTWEIVNTEDLFKEEVRE